MKILRPRTIALNCWNCARPLDDPGPRVKEKRFCSATCRSQWHARERRKAWDAHLANLAGEDKEGGEK